MLRMGVGRLEFWLDLFFHPFLEEAVQESQKNVPEEAKLILNVGLQLYLRQAPEMFEDKSKLLNEVSKRFNWLFFLTIICQKVLLRRLKVWILIWPIPYQNFADSDPRAKRSENDK